MAATPMQSHTHVENVRLFTVQIDRERGYNVRDTENGLDVVFSNLVQRRAGGLVISADTFFSSQSAQLAALALRHAVPTVSPYREFVTVLAA